MGKNHWSKHWQNNVLLFWMDLFILHHQLDSKIPGGSSVIEGMEDLE
jgi:hypothetical protein